MKLRTYHLQMADRQFWNSALKGRTDWVRKIFEIGNTLDSSKWADVIQSTMQTLIKNLPMKTMLSSITFSMDGIRGSMDGFCLKHEGWGVLDFSWYHLILWLSLRLLSVSLPGEWVPFLLTTPRQCQLSLNNSRPGFWQQNNLSKGNKLDFLLSWVCLIHQSQKSFFFPSWWLMMVRLLSTHRKKITDMYIISIL